MSDLTEVIIEKKTPVTVVYSRQDILGRSIMRLAFGLDVLSEDGVIKDVSLEYKPDESTPKARYYDDLYLTADQRIRGLEKELFTSPKYMFRGGWRTVFDGDDHSKPTKVIIEHPGIRGATTQEIRILHTQENLDLLQKALIILAGKSTLGRPLT